MKIRFSCYPGGKRRAVTFSYDDGRIYDKRVVEILNKYNLKGTFHLNSERYVNSYTDPKGYGVVPPKELKEVYSGHEISAHTYSHPDMCALSDGQLRDEILEDRAYLESVAGYVVRGMSYPFGTYNERVINAIKTMGIEYSRTTKSTMSCALPDDFLMWHPTCHHKDALKCIESFENPRWRLMSLLYIWGHSYEFNDNDNWELFEEICQKVSGKDDVWYATNIEIMDYINAMRGLKFSTDNSLVYNPSATDVVIEARENDSEEWKMVTISAGKQVNLKG